MKKSDVIGRRIVDIRQEKCRNTAEQVCFHLGSMTLDNGTVIGFSVQELGSDYAVDATVYKNLRSRGGRDGA